MIRLGAVLRSLHDYGTPSLLRVARVDAIAEAAVAREKAQRVAQRAATRDTVADASNLPLKKSLLHDLHVAHGARLMPFAGYSLPLQYADASIIGSHIFTRQHASLFDVSHMVPHAFRGADAAVFLERVTPSAIASMKPLESKLTTFLWPETGGIVDDAMVTYLGKDVYYVITNGTCRVKDSKYFHDELAKFGGDVEWDRLDGSGLVALQGPGAAYALRGALASDVNLDFLYFGHAVWVNLKLPDGSMSHPVLVTRGGYTGEDGFELFFNAELYPVQDMMQPAIESLLKSAGPNRLRLAGLGARDSLRLEAGLCLYGNDLNDNTTPVEAGLAWIIPPERRKAGGFHGTDVIIPQLNPKSKDGGISWRRVGLLVKGAPARHGAQLRLAGRVVGKVTSGMPSPSLRQNIAMAYIEEGLHKVGTKLDVVVRGNSHWAWVTKMPFVPNNYYRPRPL